VHDDGRDGLRLPIATAATDRDDRTCVDAGIVVPRVIRTPGLPLCHDLVAHHRFRRHGRAWPASLVRSEARVICPDDRARDLDACGARGPAQRSRFAAVSRCRFAIMRAMTLHRAPRDARRTPVRK